MQHVSIALKKAKVKRRWKKPHIPPLQEIFFYAFIALTILNMLISESHTHSTFYPLWCLAQLLTLYIVVSLVYILILKMPWKKVFALMIRPQALVAYSIYIATFFVTLALHFPFVLNFGG